MSNTADNRVRQIFTVDVAPWRLEQQLEACKNQEFLQSVMDKLSPTRVVKTDPASTVVASAFGDAQAAPSTALQELVQLEAAGASVSAVLSVEDLVKEKHYYAGGNARWMFALTREQVLADIKNKLDSIPNKRRVLYGSMGGLNQYTVDHLMVIYKENNRFFLSSKYIAREILNSCTSKESAYSDVYRLAAGYPLFLGWIVEFDFVAQIEHCKGGKLEFVGSNGEKCGISWDVSDVIDFDPKQNVEVSFMPVGTWLKQVKWNPEGYDLVSLLSDQGRVILRFVQTSYAAVRDVDLVPIRMLADKVKLTFGKDVGVEMFLVSPQHARPPKVNLKNEGALDQVFIGSTMNLWTAGTAESSIQRLYFNARLGS